MAHSDSHCPVCHHQIEDRSLEKCSNCGWILAVEDLLNSKYYYLLSDWGQEQYGKTTEIDRVKYRQNKLNQRLDSQRDDLDRLQAQVNILCNRIPEIKSILESSGANIKPEDRSSKLYTYSIASVESTPVEIEKSNTDRNLEASIDRNLETEVRPSADKTELPQVYQLMNSEYYHNLSQFASKYHAITVSVTKESIDRNRGNDDKVVIFEEVHRGNYWLFSVEENIYLVPTDKYINQHSYTTTSLSFDCDGYTPDYQKIQLVKPAIVTLETNSNPQIWKLRSRGEILFL